jgi:predicted DNA-binding transcriptional regulator YafY
MGRTFYTERDIEDLARRGVKEIEETDDMYITDVAREKMEALGMTAKKSAARGAATNRSGGSQSSSLSESEKTQVIEKVRSGVIARLGPGVDTTVVDTIVRRVVNQL